MPTREVRKARSGQARTWAALAQRLALAVIGGYCLSAAAAGLLALALSQAMPRSEAVMLLAMSVFIVYLVLLLWAFAASRLRNLWIVLGAGPVAAQLITSWLKQTLAGG